VLLLPALGACPRTLCGAHCRQPMCFIDDKIIIITIIIIIVLGWILGKYGGKWWTGCIWMRIGTREDVNELPSSTKGQEFLD
jgi:hypothetical protein